MLRPTIAHPKVRTVKKKGGVNDLKFMNSTKMEHIFPVNTFRSKSKP